MTTVLSARPLDDVSAIASFKAKLRIREELPGSLFDLKSDDRHRDIGYVRNENRDLRLQVERCIILSSGTDYVGIEGSTAHKNSRCSVSQL